MCKGREENCVLKSEDREKLGSDTETPFANKKSMKYGIHLAKVVVITLLHRITFGVLPCQIIPPPSKALFHCFFASRHSGIGGSHQGQVKRVFSQRDLQQVIHGLQIGHLGPRACQIVHGLDEPLYPQNGDHATQHNIVRLSIGQQVGPIRHGRCKGQGSGIEKVPYRLDRR